MATILVIIVMGSIKYGRDLQKRGRYGNFQLFTGNVLKSKTKIPLNYLKGIVSKPVNLNISIKHLDYQKLAYSAKQAEEIGFIAPHLKEEDVPAEIEYEGNKYKIKVRLKGMELKHLQPDKWSLKINLKGEHTILGLNEFSIQAPQTRAYLNEWIYHKFLNAENLLCLKTDFVNVTLNGKDLGIFNLEESFNKTVLERNMRREGLIFRIINGNVVVYEEGKILRKGLPISKQLGNVTRIGNDFVTGKVQTHEIFDLEKTAHYFAISDLFGAIHGHLEINFPLYFNPINHKIEPIGYDGNAGMIFTEGFNGIAGSWHGPWTAGDRLLGQRIFSDTVFYKRYVAHLEMIDASFYTAILDSLQDDLEEKLAILYKSFPEYYHSTEYLELNAKTIRNTLSPEGKIQNPVYCLQKVSQRFQLTFNNISNVPLKLLGIYYQNQRLDDKGQKEKIIYPHVKGDDNFESIYMNYKGDRMLPDSVLNNLQLRYKVLGASTFGEVGLKAIYGEEFEYSSNYLSGNINDLRKFDFIRVDERTKIISVVGGNHIITEDMVIPKGYTFVINQSTSIDLRNQSNLISNSPVKIIGSKEFPVKIFSSDSSAGGLTVLQAKDPSFLEYVHFENLKNPTFQSWSLSGSVNFYESPVTILNSNFDTNHNEDMLNIIQSKFELIGSVFKNTFSDAFDGDFVRGKIVNCSFENLGNDAIDVSGSTIQVEKINIIYAGDKGLSAGENSYIDAKQLTISETEIAVASKDQSHIEINNIFIHHSTIGFTCFQKKSEFDPASIRAFDVQLTDSKIPYLLEPDSKLEVNNESILPSRENVRDVLYGVEFGKKTIR